MLSTPTITVVGKKPGKLTVSRAKNGSKTVQMNSATSEHAVVLGKLKRALEILPAIRPRQAFTFGYRSVSLPAKARRLQNSSEQVRQFLRELQFVREAVVHLAGDTAALMQLCEKALGSYGTWAGSCYRPKRAAELQEGVARVKKLCKELSTLEIRDTGDYGEDLAPAYQLGYTCGCIHTAADLLECRRDEFAHQLLGFCEQLVANEATRRQRRQPNNMTTRSDQLPSLLQSLGDPGHCGLPESERDIYRRLRWSMMKAPVLRPIPNDLAPIALLNLVGEALVQIFTGETDARWWPAYGEGIGLWQPDWGQAVLVVDGWRMPLEDEECHVVRTLLAYAGEPANQDRVERLHSVAFGKHYSERGLTPDLQVFLGHYLRGKPGPGGTSRLVVDDVFQECELRAKYKTHPKLRSRRNTQVGTTP